MAKDKLKLEIQLDGLSDLEKAVQEIELLEQHSKALKDELSKLDEGSDAFKQLNKEIDNTTKSINVLKDATGQIDLDEKFDDVYESGAPLSSRLGELEDRMYALALAGQENSLGFQNLQKEAATIRQTIIRVDESVDRLAENRGIASFGDQLSAVKDSILNLDFTSASKNAEILAKNASSISFKSATTSLKGLGRTFINLGRALLANPLFLLASVVVGIVLVIKELMDQIGLTKVIMQQFGKVLDVLRIPIDILIQSLKNLTDWLGWTSNAAEDSAEKTASALEDAAKRGSVATSFLVQYLDNEIKMLELSGESAEDLKNKRLKVLSEQRKAELDAAVGRLNSAKLSKELDEEEIAALEDKVNQTRLAYNQSIYEIDFFNAESEKRRKDAVEKEVKEQKEKNKRLAEERKKAEEKRKQEEEQYNQLRLETARKIEDLRIENIENDTERELEKNRVSYDRLIEDTKNNESLLQEEKDKIIEYYQNLRVIKEAEINKKAADEEAKKLKEKTEKEAAEYEKRLTLLETFQDRQNQSTLEDNELKLLAAEEQYQDELAALQQALQNGLITKEEYAQLEIEAEVRKNDEIIKVEKNAAKEKADIEQQLADAKIGAQLNFLNATGQVFSALAGLFEEGTAAAKIATIADIALGTATGFIQGLDIAQKGSKAAGPAAPFAFPIFYATQVAAVLSAAAQARRALSAVPGGGSSNTSVSAPTIPSAPTSVPSAPTPPSLFGQPNEGNISPLSEDVAGQRQQSQEIRAYVVESDITKTQNTISNYRQRSEIG